MQNGVSRLFFLTCFLFFLCFGLNAQAQKTPKHERKSLRSGQLMVVITDGWDSLRGTLYCYSKQHRHWKLKFSNAVVVGSTGLGIGDGIISLPFQSGPVKKEGDKRSPAGIFTIGTAFGYADKKDALWIKNRYIKATDTLICVDDAHSARYNTLVNNNAATSDYNSFEYMHRKDDYYKWGLFINHNSNPAVPGTGSCIFMHIWENEHVGTVGCTAMQEENLLRVLHWINARKNPLLVQLPKAEYALLRQWYHLPAINFSEKKVNFINQKPGQVLHPGTF